MAGNYRNNRTEQESLVESWIHTITKDGGVDRYDDLHIDRINSRWKDPKTWIQAGLRVFDFALNIRDREQLPFSVVLGFSLESGTEQKHSDFGSATDVEMDLGATPPSLYLFRFGEEPWTERLRVGAGSPDVTVENLAPAIFGTSRRIKGAFYFEFKSRSDEEYSRSILLFG